MAEQIHRSMSVTGVGRIAAPPDILALTLGVVTEASTVAEALSENNKRASDVMSILKEHGVEERDIQTTRLSIEAVEEPQDPDEGRPPRVIGYRAINDLRVKIRDLEGAGSTIDAAVQSGGDASRVYSLSFSFDDPGSLAVEARERAINDAKAKAQQLTEGIGARLAGVISISESGVGGGRPVVDFATLREAPPITIAGGEQEVALQVTVQYQLSE